MSRSNSAKVKRRQTPGNNFFENITPSISQSGHNSGKKKKRQTPVNNFFENLTPSIAQSGHNSDSDAAIGDHPNTNSINRTLSQLYMTGKSTNIPQKEIVVAEAKEEAEATKEIDKVLKKKARLKERYLFSPGATFDDLGGLSDTIEDLKKYLDPEQKNLIELGFSGCKRILISGVAGVGKSKLAEGIINHCKLPSLKCTFSRLFSGNPGEVESSCRNFFNFAKSMQPCIIVMDRLERIVGKRVESRNDNDREVMTDTLIESFEELNREFSDIIIIGITNSVDALDYGFMSAARFTKKVYIDVPDEKCRSSILKVLCMNIKVSEDLKFDELGVKTPGYVGSDLRDLVDEAGLVADERLREDETLKAHKKENDLDESMETETNCPKNIIESDFYMALRKIKPSLKREGFASIPAITWADIGACDHIRKKLMATILLPVKCPIFMEKTLRGKTSCGILLHGPPGCGKTSIAKAIANEGEIAFISVKGPEVLNMYVGESERKIRDIFEKAAKAKPCVIFFDEIDALCTERAASERSNVTQSVLSQILTEMDGFDNQSCLVLAATNRLDVLDSAILRPGRFDNHIYVGIPDESARLDILRAITRNNKPPLSSEVSLKSVANDKRLRNFTGADLRGLIERAHTIACIEMYDEIGTLDESKFVIKPHHIESALKERGASISDEMLEFYLKSAKKVGLS